MKVKCDYCGKDFEWEHTIDDHNNMCDDCWEKSIDEIQTELFKDMK